MSYLPQGSKGYEPTAQALPSWLSYKPITTEVYTYVSSATRIIYNPQGTDPPREIVVVQSGSATSVQHSIKYVPLKYTGPFPAPDLGALYTTAGQKQPKSAASKNPRPTAGDSGSSSNIGEAASNSVAGSAVASESDSGIQYGGATAPQTASVSGSKASGSGGATAIPTLEQSATQTTSVGTGSMPFSVPNAVLATLSSLNSVAVTATCGAEPATSSSLSAVASSLSDQTSSAEDPFAASAASAASQGATCASSVMSANLASAFASASSASVSSASTSTISSASSTSSASLTASVSSMASASPAFGSSAGGASTASPSSISGSPPLGSGATGIGLSAGQIAGIVVSAFFGSLLLLTLLGYFIKRRRSNGAVNGGQVQHGRRISDRFASAWSGGLGGGNDPQASSRFGAGTYAPVVAGAGAAALAAAADRDSDQGSDDWEEDHLSGGDGSGFFIVGGQRRDGIGSWKVRRPSGAPISASDAGNGLSSAGAVAAYEGIGRGSPSSVSSMRNFHPSAGNGWSSRAGKGLLGRLLAGLRFARHSGRDKDKARVVSMEDDDDNSDDDDLASYLNMKQPQDERQGLMGPLNDSHTVQHSDEEESGPEMRQAGPSRWGGWDGALASAKVAVGVGAAETASYAAGRRHCRSHDQTDVQPEKYLTSGARYPDSQEEDGGDLGVYMSLEDKYGPSEIRDGISSAATVGQQGDPQDSYGSYSLGVGSKAKRRSPNLYGVAEGGVFAAGLATGARRASEGTADEDGSNRELAAGRSSQYGTALPPPPRAPRRGAGRSAAALSENNDGSGKVNLQRGSGGSDPYCNPSSAGVRDSSANSLDLGARAAAPGAAGLEAWTADHRESHASTYFKSYYPSGGIPTPLNLSGESMTEADRDRHSRFISVSTNLLGPGATRASLSASNKSLDPPSSGSHCSGGSGQATGQQHARLVITYSLGESGERGGGQSQVAAGAKQDQIVMLSSSGDGSRRPKSFVNTFEGQALREAESSTLAPTTESHSVARDATSRTGTMCQKRSMSAWGDGGQSPVTSGGSIGNDDEGACGDNAATCSSQDQRSSCHTDTDSNAAEGAGAGAGGFLGGLTARWKRLTMGMTPGPAPSSRDGASMPQVGESAAADPTDQKRDVPCSLMPERMSPPYLPAEIRSQQASLRDGLSASSSVSHQHYSREASGDSKDKGKGAMQGDEAPAPGGTNPVSGDRRSKRTSIRTVLTGSEADSMLDSEVHRAGYTASVSNAATSRSGSSDSRHRSQRSGITSSSLSTHPSAASLRVQGGGSGSSRSGGSSRGQNASEGTHDGQSDQASYASSNLQRQSTISTHGCVSSISGRAAYTGARRADRSDGGTSTASSGIYHDESTMDEELGGYPSDSRSDQATAGGTSLGSKSVDSSSMDKRSGNGEGLARVEQDARRLSSVWEGSEDEGSLYGTPRRGLGDFDEGIFASAPQHYCSPLVRAAALRQAQHESSIGGETSGSRASRPPPTLIAWVAGSASSSIHGDDQGSWRQSPRVENISRREDAVLRSEQRKIKEEEDGWKRKSTSSR